MRIPILFGAAGSETDDAWLVEGEADMPPAGYALRFTLPASSFGHVAGCTCCTPRGPAADALTRLFRARATGAAPFFKTLRVLASPAGEAAVRDALENDVVSAARYTLQPLA